MPCGDIVVKTQLSHRERVRLALDHCETDRVPIAMVCAGINPPAHKALEEYLKRERDTTVAAYLDPLIDIAGVSPQYVGPELAEMTDFWGVRRKPVSYGSGSYDEIVYYPLAEAESVDDLRDHPWPTTKWFDYSVIPERIAALQATEEYCLMSAGGNVFETSWYMRGFERIFVDLMLKPEFVHEIFRRVTDFYVEHATRILEAGAGEIDLYFTADDIGGQQGLLMSLDMWSRHLKPYHERLNKAIHAFGAKVMYHTDGSVMPAVPGLVEMGIDVLQALQFDATGMDPVALKRDFGDRLSFEGGVSVQKTLPFGTPDEVAAEVRERIDVLGAHGGYILGPSHAIQASTPPENITALFDTAANHPMPSAQEACKGD